MKDLHARRPVDSTAELVIRDGEHWEPRITDAQHDSPNPIHTAWRPPGAKDVTGLRVGRLTVVGYWGRNSNGGKGTGARHRWVVRCDCGMYSVRRVTSLQKSLTAGRSDCCQRCKALDAIWSGDRSKE